MADFNPCCQLLMRIKHAIKAKHWIRGKASSFIDSLARPHNSLLTVHKLTELGWESGLNLGIPQLIYIYNSLPRTLLVVYTVICENQLAHFFIQKSPKFYSRGLTLSKRLAMKMADLWFRVLNNITIDYPDYYLSPSSSGLDGYNNSLAQVELIW